ncbi:DUF937 domain-containing protein [Deinococcus sp.]|uniref:DUF937 domain-containing protein n=1 Tax=Deinococcus sp. TaxID=47478 RepID=UPI0025BE02E6|nr:DUF937 domain-containing protein [Deinococcus sp.]
MNISDLIQSYFDGDNAQRLGQVVGLDGTVAQKALASGLPMQLSALAEHAAHPEGQKQVLEAVSSLPQFGSITEVLSASDGASNLQRAGELLVPALIGAKSENIVNTVTRQVGGSVGGVQKILQMALPLVLSLLGRHGMNASNIGSMLSPFSGLGGTLGAANGAANTVGGAVNTGANVASNAVNTGAAAVAGAAGAAAAGLGAAALGSAGGAGGLLDLLKAQFSGAAADKLGAAAGFNGNAAGRAVQGALPVLLNAIVSKGKTEAGASDLLKLTSQFSGLTGQNGQLNATLLGDSAELARVEGQGRGLLGGLFGNVDEISGRLGSALGGSGSNASRLLALLSPLVLSVLGKHSTGMNGSALSGLLGGINTSHLTGLLPAGLTGLGALLGGSAVAPHVAVKPPEVIVAKAEPEVKTPVVAVPPAPPTVTPAPAPVAPVTTEKRGGFPWWLIPLLLLLLLGGCWLLRPKPATTATPTGDTKTAPATTPAAATNTGTFAITDPAAGAKLPAGGFALKGTGKAGDEIEVFQDGTSLGKVTVGSDGTWSQDVPSPAAGAHTYSVKGADGAELGNVATTIGATDASAANCTKDYTLSMKDGETVNEPFLFGGVGQGTGYTVTVKRGDRVVGTKAIALDGTCGWSYESKPGKGKVTYEVRPTGDAAAAPLSVINITVN